MRRAGDNQITCWLQSVVADLINAVGTLELLYEFQEAVDGSGAVLKNLVKVLSC